MTSGEMNSTAAFGLFCLFGGCGGFGVGFFPQKIKKGKYKI